MPDTARLATALADRYVIERELGAGGMATVYLAKDLKHDREVALKVLRPELERVPLDGSTSSPLATIVAPQGGLQVFAVLSDGSVEYVVTEAAATLGWYRVPPGGGRAVRLGDAPVPGAQTWSFSDNGLRVIAVKSVDRPDVYLIRNFGELLRR
jgi:serine/threonine protein kinase